MSDKVYLVVYYWYDEFSIDSVWSTEELGKKRRNVICQSAETRRSDEDDWEVEEWEVETKERKT